MAIAVIEGATLICTCGSKPSQLKVTSQQTVKIDDQLAATVRDMNPNTNIGGFGTCQVLTAAASGTPTPCALAAPGPWVPGSTTGVKIGGERALLSTDTLNCSVPGVITIMDSGQQNTHDN